MEFKGIIRPKFKKGKKIWEDLIVRLRKLRDVALRFRLNNPIPTADVAEPHLGATDPVHQVQLVR